MLVEKLLQFPSSLIVKVILAIFMGASAHQYHQLLQRSRVDCSVAEYRPKPCWAEAHEKIARMTLTIKLDRNWSSFQLANSAPPLSVTDSAIAPPARRKKILGRALILFVVASTTNQL